MKKRKRRVMKKGGAMKKGRNWWVIQAIINIVVVGLWLWGLMGLAMAGCWFFSLLLYVLGDYPVIPESAYWPKWMMFGISNFFFILLFTKPVKIFVQVWSGRLLKILGEEEEEMD